MQHSSLRLRAGADITIPSAEGWYDDYGWHFTTREYGDLLLQVVPYAMAASVTAARRHLRQEYPGLTAGELEILAERAIEIRCDADAVEAALTRAVEAHARGDRASMIEALDEAATIESPHGATPLADELRGRLLEEIEEQDEE